MNLPYFGCFTLRSTATTIDFCILLLVTTPTFSFLRFLFSIFYFLKICRPVLPLFKLFCLFSSFSLAKLGPEPCNGPAVCAELQGILDRRNSVIELKLGQSARFFLYPFTKVVR